MLIFDKNIKTLSMLHTDKMLTLSLENILIHLLLHTLNSKWEGLLSGLLSLILFFKGCCHSMRWRKGLYYKQHPMNYSGWTLFSLPQQTSKEIVHHLACENLQHITEHPKPSGLSDNGSRHWDGQKEGTVFHSQTCKEVSSFFFSCFFQQGEHWEVQNNVPCFCPQTVNMLLLFPLLKYNSSWKIYLCRCKNVKYLAEISEDY